MPLVTVYQPYMNKTREFRGSAQEIGDEMRRTFPWLWKFGAAAPLHVLVTAVDSCQAYSASMQEEQGDVANLLQRSEREVYHQLGHPTKQALWDAAVQACQWLRGEDCVEVPYRERHRWPDLDEVGAALKVVGVDYPDSLLMVESLLVLQHPELGKSEQDVKIPEIKSVVAPLPDGEHYAEAVRRANSAGMIVPVKLGGRHSAGAMVAWDNGAGGTGLRILLKPSAGVGPAEGANETSASPARREAASYALAKVCGIAGDLPECHLLQLDGAEFAAMQLIPWDFEGLSTESRGDPALPRRVLASRLKSGDLHRWAAWDYLIGNPDRHGDNVMRRDDNVVLIDEGSALAGASFDPARDKNTFVPYYLRVWSDPAWDRLTAEEKLRSMPRVSADVRKQLVEWLTGISHKDVDRVLLSYGVDPGPALMRLGALHWALMSMPADLAINGQWVL
jgi:hypothetical protein